MHDGCLQELDPQAAKAPEDADFEDAGKEPAERAAPMEEDAASGDDVAAEGEPPAEPAPEEAEADTEGDDPIPEEPAVPEMRLADAQNGDPGGIHCTISFTLRMKCKAGKLLLVLRGKIAIAGVQRKWASLAKSLTYSDHRASRPHLFYLINRGVS